MTMSIRYLVDVGVSTLMGTCSLDVPEQPFEVETELFLASVLQTRREQAGPGACGLSVLYPPGPAQLFCPSRAFSGLLNRPLDPTGMRWPLL